MRGKLSVVPTDAILPSAGNCTQRQLLAEPLWFAIFSRALWGTNAAKEIKFAVDTATGDDKSDRTCRAWASGDSEPAAGVLAALLLSGNCDAVLQYIIGDTDWWRAHQRAERITRQVDAIDIS